MMIECLFMFIGENKGSGYVGTCLCFVFGGCIYDS